jgi:hypothetical protein
LGEVIIRSAFAPIGCFRRLDPATFREHCHEKGAPILILLGIAGLLIIGLQLVPPGAPIVIIVLGFGALFLIAALLSIILSFIVIGLIAALIDATDGSGRSDE